MKVKKKHEQLFCVFHTLKNFCIYLYSMRLGNVSLIEFFISLKIFVHLLAEMQVCLLEITVSIY